MKQWVMALGLALALAACDDSSEEAADSGGDGSETADAGDLPANGTFDVTVMSMAQSMQNASYCDVKIGYANNTDQKMDSMNFNLMAAAEGAEPVKLAAVLDNVEAGASGEKNVLAATACDALAGAAYTLEGDVANCVIGGDYTIPMESCAKLLTISVADGG